MNTPTNPRRSPLLEEKQNDRPGSMSTNTAVKVLPEPDREQPSESEKKSKDGVSFKRLMRIARPERCLLTVGTLCLIFGSLFNLMLPAFVGSIIDSLGPGGQGTESQLTVLIRKIWPDADNKFILNVSVIGMAIAIFLSAILNGIRGWLFTLAGERVVARLRNNLFEAIVHLEVAFFDVTRTGELTNRLASDTTVLKEAVTINISMGLRWVATIVGGIVYLFLISWKLTLVMLSVVPLISVGARFYGVKIKNLSKKTQDALARATEVAEESFSHIRTVRSFSKEQLQARLYAERIQETYRLGATIAQMYGLFMGTISLVGSGSMLLVLWYGSTLVPEEMSVGVLLSFVLYTITVGFALAGVAGLFGSLMKAVGANTRVFEILDRVRAINTSGGDLIDDFHGHLKLEDVSFAYPSRTDTTVLDNINLEMKPGTVTALVGPSGGGKSTIVSLIERFYDPLNGRILLDGKDIRQLDPRWVHASIGLVSQEPVLFATTVKKNICYGATREYTDEEIIKAAKIANAHEFISNFVDGYDTQVGERGIRLSGGQKQRVAIARAVLTDPKILVADEATSSLDSESEFRVHEALDRLMKGRTTLVVAHRLSTVKNADVVCCIEQGRLVEQGTHTELLQKSGTYAQLVSRQLTNE